MSPLPRILQLKRRKILFIGKPQEDTTIQQDLLQKNVMVLCVGMHWYNAGHSVHGITGHRVESGLGIIQNCAACFVVEETSA